MVASLTIRTETTGLRPEFDHVLERERREVRTKPGALTPRARSINPLPLRRFRPTWKTAGDGTRFQVRQLFEQAFGCVLPLNYTPVGETDAGALEVRIVPNSLKINRVSPYYSPGRHEIEFELEEVR